jgi:pyruvate formate lyase activating enzyme
VKLKIFEKGFNYSQDGAGNRLVFHLQGCNLRCPWCANPEGISKTPPLLVNEKLLLDQICPHGAIHDHKLERSVCKTCLGRECINEFKNKGIICKCNEYEVDDIVNEVIRCSPMFFDGGGITLTGGEPTQQFDSVKELLAKLKKVGIHTAIETNGTCKQLPVLFPYIDQLMMDLKHYDSKMHRHITGEGNETIKDNILKATTEKKTVFIRIPLVNGFNATEENLQGTMAFLKTLDLRYVIVEFLRFHEYGKEKWKQCGMVYRMDDSAYVSKETYEQFQKTIENNGIKVIKT